MYGFALAVRFHLCTRWKTGKLNQLEGARNRQIKAEAGLYLCEGLLQRWKDGDAWA